MKIDIRRYLSLRDSLLKEKSELEIRLNDISKALGQDSIASSGAPSTPQAAPRSDCRGRRGLSLRDAVLQVASGTPVTKEEILHRVQSLGYRFSTKNPLNSLGVILYGKNPRFRNEGGRFSVAAQGREKPLGAVSAGRTRKRRTMSPEGRARIAAAQRARWAKARVK
jgi:hypothetical protein